MPLQEGKKRQINRHQNICEFFDTLLLPNALPKNSLVRKDLM